jgi:hypothetical protein
MRQPGRCIFRQLFRQPDVQGASIIRVQNCPWLPVSPRQRLYGRGSVSAGVVDWRHCLPEDIPPHVGVGRLSAAARRAERGRRE